MAACMGRGDLGGAEGLNHTAFQAHDLSKGLENRVFKRHGPSTPSQKTPPWSVVGIKGARGASFPLGGPPFR